MSYHGRSINEAYDRISKTVIKAEEVFYSQGEGFRLREANNQGTIDLECVVCKQPLGTPPSAKGNVYFRHYAKSEDCILKETNVEPEIIEGYYSAFRAGESQRHKDLKNRIGKGLLHVPGVEKESINIDKHFIIRGGKKRRPDVYCKYNGLELAFEIQISNLPLKYIIHRLNFYRKHNIYLFWILDRQDPRLQDNLMRDIKNINSFHNMFSLNEETEHLRFNCFFKKAFIYCNSEVHQTWFTHIIYLPHFKFSKETVEPYYYDYPGAKASCENELSKIQENAALENEKQHQEARTVAITKGIEVFSTQISNYRKRDYDFYQMLNYLDDWDCDELEFLNKKLGLKEIYKDGLPVLIFYTRNYSRTRTPSVSFVEYLIREERITLDVNLKTDTGSGCLQALYEHPYLHSRMYKILPAIFNRGYKLTEFDRAYFIGKRRPEHIDECTIYELEYLNRLSNKSLAPLLISNFNFLLFIESALQRRMINTGLRTWVQFIDRMFHRYKDYWYYSKLALKKNGAWEMVLAEDRKGTILRKEKELNLLNARGEPAMDELLDQLFPELFVESR